MFQVKRRKALFLAVMCSFMYGPLHAASLTFVVPKTSETSVNFDVSENLNIGPIAPGETYKLDLDEHKELVGTKITPTIYSLDNPGLSYACDSFVVEGSGSYIATLGLNASRCIILCSSSMPLS